MLKQEVSMAKDFFDEHIIIAGVSKLEAKKMKFKLTEILVSDNKDLLIDKNKPGVVFKYERKKEV